MDFLFLHGTHAFVIHALIANSKGTGSARPFVYDAVKVKKESIRSLSKTGTWAAKQNEGVYVLIFELQTVTAVII